MSEKREGTKYYERMELGRSGMVLTMIMIVFQTWLNSQVSLFFKLLAGLFLIVPFYIIRIDSSARLKRALLIEQLTDYELFRYFANVFEKEKKKPKKYIIF